MHGLAASWLVFYVVLACRATYLLHIVYLVHICTQSIWTLHHEISGHDRSSLPPAATLRKTPRNEPSSRDLPLPLLSSSCALPLSQPRPVLGFERRATRAAPCATSPCAELPARSPCATSPCAEHLRHLPLRHRPLRRAAPPALPLHLPSPPEVPCVAPPLSRPLAPRRPSAGARAPAPPVKQSRAPALY